MARRVARTILSAVATPMEPPRKPYSLTITATRWPWSVPAPVRTASSAPVRSAAATSAAR